MQLLVVLLGSSILLAYIAFSAPSNFPQASFVKIQKGMTITDTATYLKEHHIIRSATLFKVLALLHRGSAQIVSGAYFFHSQESLFTVTTRIVRGNYGMKPVRVTIPDGSSVNEITDILEEKIPDFDAESFRVLAKDKEGYLFPDTYFFLQGEDPSTALSLLETNFYNRMKEVSTAETLKKSDKPFPQIVTMASILEKEAATMHDRRVIAGILWKRITIGMPLQVDAVFPYIIGKYSLQLTRADLKTNSPYNTYTNKGLPPGPICSPSADAVLAAATPLATEYLFYLSDAGGVMHYSATYAEHLENKRKYLLN